MITRKRSASLRAVSVTLIAAFFVAACGGSSSSSPEPLPTTSDVGMVGLWFTDLPTDDFSKIILTVSEASLIGDDEERQVLFTGETTIDLLNLTNYSEPVFFGEVRAGNYKKIRLMIDDIELVHVCPMANPGCVPDSDFVEKLPANGKVDLLDAGGFDVVPGRHVTIEIDIDANKSIHVVNAGNRQRYKFRPVVKANIYESGLAKLARLEGEVRGEPDGSNGSFVLCSDNTPDFCIDVATDLTSVTGTSFFDDQGLGTDFTGLANGAMVVVIGEYSEDPYVLNAVVVEIGGNAEQVSGEVFTEPEESRFLVLTTGGESLVVELQPETKFYDADGATDSSKLVFGADVEVEGVRLTMGDAEDPDLRAALVFIEEPQDTLLSGTVTPMSQDEIEMRFELMLGDEDSTLVNVCLADGASILLVNTADMTVGPGVFADITDNAIVDVFGTQPEVAGGCFNANEVIVDVTPATTT